MDDKNYMDKGFIMRSSLLTGVFSLGMVVLVSFFGKNWLHKLCVEAPFLIILFGLSYYSEFEYFYLLSLTFFVVIVVVLFYHIEYGLKLFYYESWQQK